jgi:thioredoxin 1
MATQTITLENFESTINDNAFVILDFWAAWCGPCRAFAPVFSDASDKHPDIVFGKIDTEEQRELAMGLQISSIPTVMIFRDGIRIYSQPGSLPGPAFSDLIERARAVDMEEVRKHIEAQAHEHEHEA